MLDILETPWSRSFLLEQQVQDICTRQARYGFMFDMEKADSGIAYLSGLIDAIDAEVVPLIPQNRIDIKSKVTIEKPFIKNGDMAQHIANYWGQDSGLVRGPFSKVGWEPINLSSDKQVKEFLLSIGWEPDEWNENDDGERTSPKLTESSLSSVTHPIGKHIANRLMYKHRLGLVKGLAENVRPDGRIGSVVNPLGTSTGRGTHSVIANLPKGGYEKDGSATVFFGNEIRDLFIAAPGYILLGGDAKGLQLRCLAHYVADEVFTESIIHGDVHTDNWNAVGNLCPTRPIAKNLIYGLIFGAGDIKLARTAGHSGSEKQLRAIGEEIRRRLVGRVEGFVKLTEGVERALQTRGYLKALDGRRVFPRGSHTALCYLLQSMEAVVMKAAMVEMNKRIAIDKLDAHQVCFYHDELIYEVKEGQEEALKAHFMAVMPWVGQQYASKCPLEADVKIGSSWKHTH